MKNSKILKLVSLVFVAVVQVCATEQINLSDLSDRIRQAQESFYDLEDVFEGQNKSVSLANQYLRTTQMLSDVVCEIIATIARLPKAEAGDKYDKETDRESPQMELGYCCYGLLGNFEKLSPAESFGRDILSRIDESDKSDIQHKYEEMEKKVNSAIHPDS